MEEELLAQLEEKQEWIDHLERSLSEYERHISGLYHEIQGLEWLLQDTRNALSYKLAQRVSRATRWIAAPGSRSRKLLRLGLRGMRTMPRIVDAGWMDRQTRALLVRLSQRIAFGLDTRWPGTKRLLGPRVYRRLAFHDLPCFQPIEPIQVSIVIPVFNHYQDTLACLRSISRSTDGPTYEVIVVDDGSTDETPDLLAWIPGLVGVRNDRNLGFIGSCNRGAAAARGQLLVFLNNDTVVTPGWLRALRDTFQGIPDAGLAGAKLTFPDGRLQEAGGVIWRDGSAWNYGRSDDPDRPRYNYAREVDYCSGACIMVPADLFRSLNGFDPFYAPAYYEDVDLAFKIREAGFRVVYQPLARIIHLEGLTSGTSTESGVKSYQRTNESKFRGRWGCRLVTHPPVPPPEADRNEHARRYELAARDRVLVLDARLIMPDRDCGSLRMMELIRAIRRRGHHVTFVPNHMEVYSPYLENLLGIGVEVIHPPHYHSIPQYLRLHGSEFKLAIVSRADVAARNLAAVRRYAPQARVVFDTVDLHFLREERQAQVQRDEALKAVIAERKRKELNLARLSDMTLVVSPVEKEIIERECPGLDVRVLPTLFPFEEREIPGFAERRGIIFIGGFQHPANVDGVPYFIREILPRITRQFPDVVFQVIGPDVPDKVLALATAQVRFLGFVPDVNPLFDGARVAVAPIRFGAGVKGKVNQSMALGVPTVATSIAAEGMYLTHGHDAMIADDPAAFAEAVVQLYTNEELWYRVSWNGRDSVRRHFSVEASAGRVDELLEWAGVGQASHGLTAKQRRADRGHHAPPQPRRASSNVREPGRSI
jgi:GT2 family glycosyltransferase